MPGVSELFDKYALRARYLPALITTLPGVVVLALLFPGLYTTLKGVLTALGGTAVLLFTFAHVIRARGRQLQGELYEQWGGAPTTAWLRHRDSRLDSHTKQRYHSYLAAHVPKLVVPSSSDEATDPVAADSCYGSAVKWLLEHTRDAKKHPLVFEENITYGFRRNMLAAKPIALSLLMVSGLISAWIAVPSIKAGQLADSVAAAWLVIAVALVFWLFMATKGWVRDASDGYARALLAACEGR